MVKKEDKIWREQSRQRVLKFLEKKERTLEELGDKFPDDDYDYDVWMGSDGKMKGMIRNSFIITDKGKKFLKKYRVT